MYQLRKANSTPVMKKRLTINNVNAMDTAAAAQGKDPAGPFPARAALAGREEKG